MITVDNAIPRFTFEVENRDDYNGMIRLDLQDRFNWSAETPEEYEAIEKRIDALSVMGFGWDVYASYDVSGFDYWMVNMEETNYLHITVAFHASEIAETEIPLINGAVENIIMTGFDIQDACEMSNNKLWNLMAA